VRQLLAELETTRAALLNLVNSCHYVHNKRIDHAMKEAEQALESNRQIIARTKKRLDAWLDFKEVKAMATMADVLSHYNVLFQHKTQIYIPCPLPSHTSKHSSNSLSVNLERNVWACKSESCISGRNGKEVGNVLDFVMWMERCDLKLAAEKIMQWLANMQRYAINWAYTSPTSTRKG
jgi:hypothetical protein